MQQYEDVAAVVKEPTVAKKTKKKKKTKVKEKLRGIGDVQGSRYGS